MSGCWVLLSDGALLRRGYTTGTTAAAACKGAVATLAKSNELSSEAIQKVEILTPANIRVNVPVSAKKGMCTAVKRGGDHESDVTSGIVISARAEVSKETELVPGSGVGRITRPGLCAAESKPAISQSARREIMGAIEEGLFASGIPGARVELNVHGGEGIAKKTLNPKVGVVGGISILGSTGFVEPWNEHLGESRIEEIKGLKRVVVTTGRIGLRYSRILFPKHKVVLIGSQLERLEFGESQDSILCGLPALILKWGMPEILESTGYSTVAEMVEKEPDHLRIELALENVIKRVPNTRIVLLCRDGRILKDVAQ